MPFAELSNSIVRPKLHSRGNSRDSRCVVVPLDNHSAYTLVCRECANFRCLVPADLQTVNRNLNWINQQQFTISDRPPKCKSIVIMSWRTATVGGMDIIVLLLSHWGLLSNGIESNCDGINSLLLNDTRIIQS